MLSTAAASALIDSCQCSWKLESSIASTSSPGSSTASSSGVPMLPQALALSPAASSIDSSIVVVVVLPLVPVIASHFASLVPRIRQASSTSPMTGMPAAAAAASTGWSGRQPGEVTTRSMSPSGRDSTCWAPRRMSTSKTSRIWTFSLTSEVSSPSMTMTSAPRTPRPVTRMRSPAREELGPLKASGIAATAVPASGFAAGEVSAAELSAGAVSGRFSANSRHPFGVEEADAGDDEECGDDPESDHDRHFGPALEFEVMLQRRHPEHPFAGGPERHDLDDHGQGDDDEESAEDDEQQFGPRHDRQSGEGTAEGQRARVAHEDLRR